MPREDELRSHVNKDKKVLETYGCTEAIVLDGISIYTRVHISERPANAN